MKLRLPLLLASILLATYSQVSTSNAAPSGESISINLASNWSGSNVSGTEMAGVIEVIGDNWNNAPNANGTLNNLKNNAGNTIAGASVTWASRAIWGITGTATNLQETLHKGYMAGDYGERNTATITFTNLPFLVSDVYVIAAGEKSDKQIQSVNVNGVFYRGDGTTTVEGSDPWGLLPNKLDAAYIEGQNYLKITGITGSSIHIYNGGVVTEKDSAFDIIAIQVADGYTGNYLYRTLTAGTANWTDNLWSDSDVGTANKPWSNTNTAAVINAAAGGSILNVSSGTQADGLILNQGKLTLDGTPLTLAGPSVIRVLEGATLIFNYQVADVDTLDLTGGGTVGFRQNTAFLQINHGLNLDIGSTTTILGGTDNRWTGVTGRSYYGDGNGILNIFLDTNWHSDGYGVVNLGDDTSGIKEVHIDGAFAVEREGAFSNLGNASLHLKAGSFFVARTSGLTFGNDIYLESGTHGLKNYGSITFQLTSNIYGGSETILLLDDSGGTHFSGDSVMEGRIEFKNGKHAFIGGTSSIGTILVDGNNALLSFGLSDGLTGDAVVNLGAGGIEYNNGTLQFGKATLGATTSWSTSQGTDKKISVTSVDGTVFKPGNHTITLNHVLEGDGKIVVDNTGTGSLAIASVGNIHTETVVKAGQLKLAESSSAGKKLTMHRGSSVTGTSGTYQHVLGAGGNLTLTGTGTATATITGNLVFSGGRISFDLGTLSNTSPALTVTGNMNFLSESDFSLFGNYDAGHDYLGSYLIATASGGITNFNENMFMFISEVPEFAAKYKSTITQSGNNLMLTIGENNDVLQWKGGSGNWNKTDTNWFNLETSGNVRFVDGSKIQFDDEGGAPATLEVNVTGVMTPADMKLANKNKNYVFSGAGAFKGAFVITKSDTGNVTFNLSSPDYKGRIDLQKGTITVAADNALGAGNVSFNGGTLALEKDTLFTDVASSDSVRLFVGSGKSVKATTASGNNSLYDHALVKTGDGTLTLAGTVYNGTLTNSGGSLVISTEAGAARLMGGYSGNLIVEGTNEFFLSAQAFNAANGNLTVRANGKLRFGTEELEYSGGTGSIILETGAEFKLNPEGDNNQAQTTVTSNRTLVMGAGAKLLLHNGGKIAPSGNSFNMLIQLNGGTANDASIIGGIIGGNVLEVNSKITGNGNLLIERNTSGYTDMVTFKTNWNQNDYTGYTDINITDIRYDATGMTAGAGNVISPWSTGKVTIGGRTDNATSVTFLNLDAASVALNNELVLQSRTKATTLNLYNGQDGKSATLNKKVTASSIAQSGETMGELSIIGSKEIIFAGGIGGDQNLTLSTKNAADSRIVLNGDSSAYTGTLNIKSTKTVLLGTAANKVFGGGLAINGGNLRLDTGSQTVNGNINLASGAFVFDTSALSMTSVSLTIGGGLTIDNNSKIQLDNGSGSLTQDGTYELISIAGTLTNSFDLSGVTWLNDTKPESGTYTLTYIDNKLYLTVAGLSSMLWHGDADGNGTWKVGTAGWGVTGTDPYANGKAVTFSDIAGKSAASVTLEGDVNPNGITVSLKDTAITFKGDGRIIGTSALKKEGTGELVIENANAYSGGTQVKDGTLTVKKANALGSGKIDLEGGKLVLGATGDLLVSGNNIVFKGGKVSYAGAARQDISALIDGTASTQAIKVEVQDAANTVAWGTSFDALKKDLIKDGAGRLNLLLTTANTSTLTASDGMLGLTLSGTASLDLGKLAGTAGIEVDNNRGSLASITGSATGFTGELTLKSSDYADQAKGFTIDDLSALSADGKLVLDGALLGSTGASALNAELEIKSLSSIGLAGETVSAAGALTGTAGLKVNDGATLSLTGLLTGYSGALTAGTGSVVNFGTGGASGAGADGIFIGSASLGGTGTYNVNYSGDTVLSAVVRDSANLTQSGNGNLTLTGANTTSGTLTIGAGKTVRLGDGTTDGSWAGAIDGMGTLLANNTGNLTIGSLGAQTTLNHIGTGALTVNLADASAYQGEMILSGGGTLDLNGGAYTNGGYKLTVSHGTLTGADNAGNIHVDAKAYDSVGDEAAAVVDLRSLSSTGNIKSLKTSTGGSVVKLSSFLTLGTADLMLHENNLADNGGNAVVLFDSPDSVLTLDTLSLRITGPLSDFLRNDRDNYNIQITNGKLAGDIVDPGKLDTNILDFKNYLLAIGYRPLEVNADGGYVRISDRPEVPVYTVLKDQPEVTINSANQLDGYDSIFVEGTLTFDVNHQPGNDTITVNQLAGYYEGGVVNAGKVGMTLVLNNDNEDYLTDDNVQGTEYYGSIYGAANIEKTGEFDLFIGNANASAGGNIDIGGNLSVTEGNMTVHGDVRIGGHTSVAGGTSLTLGRSFHTGSLNLEAGSTLDAKGNVIQLTGAGNKSNILATGSNLLNASGIVMGDGGILSIGAGMDLPTLTMGNRWSLDTESNLNVTGLNGSGNLTLHNAVLTLTGNDDASMNGTMTGSGSIIKKGSGTQTLMAVGDYSGYDLNVLEGTVLLRRSNLSVSRTPVDAQYNTITVHGGAGLAIGGRAPADSSVPTTVYANSAVFHAGSTLSVVIPNQTGSLVATGTVTLPTQLTLNLVNNDDSQFGHDVPVLTVMKADGGYLWDHDGSAIVKGHYFDGWDVTLEKSIALFYGSADVTVGADGKTLLATPTDKRSSNALLGVAQTQNATAGAHLLWDAGLQKAGTNLDNLLSCIMDAVKVGDNGRASRMMAASVGSTYMGLLSAQQADFRYQQGLIRNRITGMGLSQDYSYRDDLPFYNAWVQGNASYNKLDSDGDDAGHELESWGGTVGFDMNVSQRLTIGTAFTASYGDITASSADSLEGDLNMYYVNLFGRYQHKRWTHVLILTGAWGEADADRTVAFCNGAYRSHAKTDASSYGAMYELTYDIALNKNKTTVFQPLFNASITKTKVDAFGETGSDNAGLNVGDMDVTMGTISAGGRLLGLVGSNVFGRESVGELRAQVLQDIGPDHAAGDVSYQVNPGLSQRIRGAKIGRTGVQFGAGLTIPVGEQGSIFTDANIDLRNRATSVNGSLGYRYNF